MLRGSCLNPLPIPMHGARGKGKMEDWSRD
jgi:hypothetical protein